jgi:hypothetical protein
MSCVFSHSTDKTVDKSKRSYRSSMGFNPFREQNRSAVDIVMVILAVGSAIALVLWAIFSG